MAVRTGSREVVLIVVGTTLGRWLVYALDERYNRRKRHA